MAYGVMAVVATGDVGTSAWANGIKDNFDATFNTSGQTIASTIVAVTATGGSLSTSTLTTWEDVATVSITPRTASGYLVVMGGFYNASDDPFECRVGIDSTFGQAVRTSQTTAVSSGYSAANGSSSAQTAKLQGYMVSGSGTDALEDGWIVAFWIP